MAIGVCDYCGKPFNNVGGKLCIPCTKIVDETYVKIRRYIYQNPKESEFLTILEATDVPEKALNYLIKKGRIEVVGSPSGGAKCRACGKDTSGSAICEQCMAKIVSEKLMKKETKETKDTNQVPAKPKIIPLGTK